MYETPEAEFNRRIRASARELSNRAAEAVDLAHATALQGCRRVQENFPGWMVNELKGLELRQPGVTVGDDEMFAGESLFGRRVAFCYIEGGRWVAATYYFLEDHNSVWILRFTGRMGLLDANHDVTDQIARSFAPM